MRICFLKTNFSNKSLEEIEKNIFYIDLIMFRFVQIAENAARLSLEYKITHQEIPWRKIKGMRNRIVHNYGVVDLKIIYETLVYNVPEMYDILIKISEE